MERNPASTDSALRLQAGEARLRSQLLLGLDGDAAAYQAFLQAMSAHLRAFFKRRMTSLPDDIEDLVQETLLALHNQRHTYHRDQPLTVGDLAAGARTTFLIVVKVHATAPNGVMLRNTAALTSTTPLTNSTLFADETTHVVLSGAFLPGSCALMATCMP